MSSHIKAVTKALFYPLYPPNLARRRFRIPDILFTAGTVTSHARKLPNWNKQQRTVRSLLGSLPLLCSLWSQSRIRKSDIGQQNARYHTTFKAGRKHLLFFPFFFLSFRARAILLRHLHTTPPHTWPGTDGRTQGGRGGGREADEAIARWLCAGQTIV